jgi:hypothetical protein
MGITHVLHCLFIKSQGMGELYGTFYAICSARDMEGANKSHQRVLFMYGASY